MKTGEEIEDDVLGRWLAGELSGKELQDFEASDVFHTYKAIADYSDNLIGPDYDIDAAYTNLQTAIKSKKQTGKVIKMSAIKKWSIAASIAILIGVGLTYFLTLNPITTVSTAQGETKSILLPDNSKIDLNIASNIEYDKENWENNRSVDLNGEAYFKVSKGNRFVVNTNHGFVEVLGTEFNIRNRDNYTEVICYEGKVKVTDLQDKSVILIPGQNIRINNGILENDWSPIIGKDPEWKNGSSSFYEVNLITVINELENQYKLKVICDSTIYTRSFSGAFPHNSLDAALQLIFDPLELNYEIGADGSVIVE